MSAKTNEALKIITNCLLAVLTLIALKIYNEVGEVRDLAYENKGKIQLLERGLSCRTTDGDN